MGKKWIGGNIDTSLIWCYQETRESKPGPEAPQQFSYFHNMRRSLYFKGYLPMFHLC